LSCFIALLLVAKEETGGVALDLGRHAVQADEKSAGLGDQRRELVEPADGEGADRLAVFRHQAVNLLGHGVEGFGGVPQVLQEARDLARGVLKRTVGRFDQPLDRGQGGLGPGGEPGTVLLEGGGQFVQRAGRAAEILHGARRVGDQLSDFVAAPGQGGGNAVHVLQGRGEVGEVAVIEYQARAGQ
jgi:hypothetical protein